MNDEQYDEFQKSLSDFRNNPKWTVDSLTISNELNAVGIADTYQKPERYVVGSVLLNGVEYTFDGKNFYKNFNKIFVSAEDCPRHTKEYLQRMKEQMSKLGYAQEFLAVFTDELKRLFDEDLINAICKGARKEVKTPSSDYYLGVDVAGLGEDECTYEVFEMQNTDFLRQTESIIEKRNFTTDTSKKVIQLQKIYDFEGIGIDDGGVGFGVYSELMDEDETKRITQPLNNASRDVDDEGIKSRKLLKEEMYINLQILMENNKIQLLDDDEVRASLASIQHDEGKIFGSYSHVTEGIIRAVWLASKNKGNKLWIR